MGAGVRVGERCGAGWERKSEGHGWQADTERTQGSGHGTGSALGRTWAGGGRTRETGGGAILGRTFGRARPRRRETICGGTRDQQEKSGARKRGARICDGAHRRQRDGAISVSTTCDPGGRAAADAPASHARTSGSASQATGRDHDGGAWRGARRGGGRDGQHGRGDGCNRGGEERVTCGG